MLQDFVQSDTSISTRLPESTASTLVSPGNTVCKTGACLDWDGDTKCVFLKVYK